MADQEAFNKLNELLKTVTDPKLRASLQAQANVLAGEQGYPVLRERRKAAKRRSAFPSRVNRRVSPDAQRILRLRLGLEDGRIWTLREVGREFGVSHELIRLIEDNALYELQAGHGGSKALFRWRVENKTRGEICEVDEYFESVTQTIDTARHYISQAIEATDIIAISVLNSNQTVLLQSRDLKSADITHTFTGKRKLYKLIDWDVTNG